MFRLRFVHLLLGIALVPFVIGPIHAPALNGHAPWDTSSRKQAVTSPLYGIDFSPYENGQDPNKNPTVSADQIRARLQIFAPYTVWARSFSMTTGLENLPPIARSLGLKVAAGAWISKDLSQNNQEVLNLIDAANKGNVDIAIVGSEVLLRGDLTEAQLLAYMAQVRAAIPSNIPVTTADTYGILLGHPNVIAASDVVFPNFYPYWEGKSIDAALCALVADYAAVVKAANGKQVVVSEAGWPSGGNAYGAALPTPANAAQFALQFVTWARAYNISFFYFEAFNEEWKVEQGSAANWPECRCRVAARRCWQEKLSGNQRTKETTLLQAADRLKSSQDCGDILKGALMSALNANAAAGHIARTICWKKPEDAVILTPTGQDKSPFVRDVVARFRLLPSQG